MGKWTEAAQKVRKAMDTANAVLSDEAALETVAIYPLWTLALYAVGDRVQYNEKLYKCVQAHMMRTTRTIKSAITANVIFAR